MSALLREWSSFKDSNIVLEYQENPTTGVKDCYLVGVMVQADTRNLNERVYPLNEITRAVEKMREQLRNGESILCECDHPDTLTINLDRVAGMLVDVWMEGKNGLGRIKLLNTNHGKDLRVMLESGVKLGVSSRGAGEVDYNGIVHDYEIVTIDIVAKPSAPDAYPQAVFESLYKTSGHYISEKSDHIKPLGTTKTNTNIGDEIVAFFNDLSKQK